MTTRTARRSPRQTIDPRTAAAYHEAGHAVLAHFLAVPFESVGIRTDAENVGQFTTPRVDWKALDLHTARDRAERELLVCLAGLQAERLIDPATPAYSGAQDNAIAYGLASVLIPHPPESEITRAILDGYSAAIAGYLAYLTLRANRLVWKHRHAVRLVAKALLQHTEMTAVQVAQVLAGADQKA